MTSTAMAMRSSTCSPRLCAVEIAPTPSGLVSTSASPGRAPAFVSSSSGCTVPATDRPYFGSGSSMECPPATDAPAAWTTAAPPRRISPSTSGPRRSRGKRDDVERGQRRAAHGVDVRQRVGRGDAAEVVRVVDDRGEEVDRLDQRDLGRELDDGRVVGSAGTDEQAVVPGPGRQRADDRQEVRGGELAPAAGAVAERGERHVEGHGRDASRRSRRGGAERDRRRAAAA